MFPSVPIHPDPKKRKGLARLLPPGVCVGLVLGGGAARALAHIGVIRVFEEKHVPIHLITGCSFGALVGGAYAATQDIQAFEKKVIAYIESDGFQRKAYASLQAPRGKSEKFNLRRFIRRGIYYSRLLFKQSFFSKEDFAKDLHAVIPEILIEKLAIPFACNAVDIDTGEEKIFRNGPLCAAVMASSAIPGIFPPITLGEHHYIDGGWANSLPVDAAADMGSDFIVAVDVSYTMARRQKLSSGMDIIARGAQIKSNRIAEMSRQKADALIRPEVDDIAWVDFTRVREIIQRGEEAARKALPQIAANLRRRTWKERIPFRKKIIKWLK